MEKTKILVVDDEPDVVDTVRFFLEQEGYEVTTAANGLEALGVVRANPPDLVVLDVMMPGENGYRVSRMIREDEAAGRLAKHIPIILLTARDLSGDPEREALFNDFSQSDLTVYKPFSMTELMGRVHQLLAA